MESYENLLFKPFHAWNIRPQKQVSEDRSPHDTARCSAKSAISITNWNWATDSEAVAAAQYMYCSLLLYPSVTAFRLYQCFCGSCIDLNQAQYKNYKELIFMFYNKSNVKLRLISNITVCATKKKSNVKLRLIFFFTYVWFFGLAFDFANLRLIFKFCATGPSCPKN